MWNVLRECGQLRGDILIKPTPSFEFFTARGGVFCEDSASRALSQSA